jgi:hypothetical protein
LVPDAANLLSHINEQVENASSLILESSRAGTKPIIDHSAIAHSPNIRHVAVCFNHASNIEAIGLARIALVLTRNPKSSITAGNSTVEQRKQLPAVWNIDYCPRPLPVGRVAGRRSTKRRSV